MPGPGSAGLGDRIDSISEGATIWPRNAKGLRPTMSTEPVPAHILIFDEIIEDLNTLLGAELDDLSRARVFKDLEGKAQSLAELSPPHGLSVLGSIAAARRNIPAMRDYHRRSIKMSNDIVLRSNYATSLYVAGLFDAAHDAALAVYSDHKDDPEVLDLLVKTAWAMDRFDLFDEYAALFERLSGHQHQLAKEEDEGDIRAAEEAMADGLPGTPWEEVKKELGW